MSFVFVCSKFRPDPALGEEEKQLEHNLRVARLACRLVVKQGDIPFAPHLLYPLFLDDSKEEERELGICAGIRILAICDRILVVENGIERRSEGMRAEISIAGMFCIPQTFVMESYLIKEFGEDVDI